MGSLLTLASPSTNASDSQLESSAVERVARSNERAGAAEIRADRRAGSGAQGGCSGADLQVPFSVMNSVKRGS